MLKIVLRNDRPYPISLLRQPKYFRHLSSNFNLLKPFSRNLRLTYHHTLSRYGIYTTTSRQNMQYFYLLFFLKSLLKRIDVFAIYVFSYAIWREKHFVDKFTISELNNILKTLLEVLKKVNKGVNFLLTRALELLLGLLHTRDPCNEEIKMLLQPHQKITKDFSREIDRIANIVEKNNLTLYSPH